MPVSKPTKRTSFASTSSPTDIPCQSRPRNAGSTEPALGGLFKRSCIAAEERENCRLERGEGGTPRIWSLNE